MPHERRLSSQTWRRCHEWSGRGVRRTSAVKTERSSGVFALCGEASGFFTIATDRHDAPATPSGGIEEQPSTPGPGARTDAVERRRGEELAG